MNYKLLYLFSLYFLSSISLLNLSNLHAQSMHNNIIQEEVFSTNEKQNYTQNDSYHSQALNTDFCVIVRYPVHANKLSLLQKQLNNPEMAVSARKIYDQTIQDNSAYFNLITNTFKEHFNVVPYFFLPDSSFKVYNVNPQGLFVNDKEMIDPSLSCPYNQYYLLITGNDEDQWLFVTKELVRAPEPLPFKKKIFFPSFKKIFNRTGYLATQIKYFNEQLSKNASK